MAINEHEKIRLRKQQDMAEALRIARFADAKEWKRFIRRKT